jgi:hypothetical protein
MVIFHDILHERTVLVLASDTSHPGPAEAELARHLDQAYHSGRPVWIDCRLLDAISAPTVWLLGACQRRLHRRRRPLVLCHVAPRVAQQLCQLSAGMKWCLADNLDDPVPRLASHGE